MAEKLECDGCGRLSRGGQMYDNAWLEITKMVDVVWIDQPTGPWHVCSWDCAVSLSTRKVRDEIGRKR